MLSSGAAVRSLVLPSFLLLPQFVGQHFRDAVVCIPCDQDPGFDSSPPVSDPQSPGEWSLGWLGGQWSRGKILFWERVTAVQN